MLRCRVAPRDTSRVTQLLTAKSSCCGYAAICRYCRRHFCRGRQSRHTAIFGSTNQRAKLCYEVSCRANSCEGLPELSPTDRRRRVRVSSCLCVRKRHEVPPAHAKPAAARAAAAASVVPSAMRRHASSSMSPAAALLLLLLPLQLLYTSAQLSDNSDGRLPCSSEHAVLSGHTAGKISILRTAGDGSYVDYPNSTSCAWLIVGGANTSIVIQFEFLYTECNADFVYVYDGQSLMASTGSRLLGSFSGSTLPDVLVAISGYVTVYFASDVSHTGPGFALNYTVLGKAASIDSLLLNRSSFSSYSKVVCGVGLPLLPSCDVNLSSPAASAQWVVLSSASPLSAPLPGGGKISGRAGHTAVWCPLVQSLFVFGGCDATGNAVYDDLWLYNLTSASWARLAPRVSGSDSVSIVQPALRHAHAAAYVNNGSMYVYGGLLSAATPSDGETATTTSASGFNRSSDELWHFSTVSQRWTALPRGPHAVHGHTLTAVDDRWLYLLGGTMADGSLSGLVHRYDVVDRQWQEVALTGSWAQLKLTGHTTVYDAQTRSLLTFGGHRPDTARFVVSESMLYILNVDNRHLSRLDTGTSGSSHPQPLAFHSASVVGRYMAVYGGTTISDDGSCVNAKLHFYHMGCHRWVDPVALESSSFPAPSSSSSSGSNKPVWSIADSKGRFMHAAAVAYGNVLLLVGGYRGNVLDDVIAYVMPRTVALFQAPGDPDVTSSPSASSLDLCTTYSSSKTCGMDPECIWYDCITPQPSHCLRSTVVMPSGCRPPSSLADSCPGVCSFLTSCTACTLNGQRSSDGSGCVWCVASRSCISSAVYESNNNLCLIRGWWNGTSSAAAVVRTASSCRIDDRPPGVFMSVLKNPSDFKRPDKVFFVQKTLFETPTVSSDITTNCNFQCAAAYADSCSSCYSSVEVTGYIHLPSSGLTQWPVAYRVGVLKSMAFLYVFCSETQVRPLYVLNETAYTQEYSAAPLLLAPTCSSSSVGDKSDASHGISSQRRWRFLLRGPRLAEDPASASWSISLQWNATNSMDYSKLTSSYLEAYSSGNCTMHDTCLGCVSDMGCGWCPLVDSCIDRTASVSLTSSECGGTAPSYWLITDPDYCTACSEHIDCKSCASSRYCEWLPDQLTCIRRGRSSTAIGDPSKCSLPCRLRSSCDACLIHRDECVWCNTEVGCVSQLELQTTYLYGQCRSWIENFVLNESAAVICRSCERSLTCGDCLGGDANRPLPYGRRELCGWCYDVSNPKIGVCVRGDYSGPTSSPGTGSSNSSTAGRRCLARLTSIAAAAGAAAGSNDTALAAFHSGATVAGSAQSSAADWAFAVCPDVDECRLHYDNCSRNATCLNTPTLFTCTCREGFVGDGYSCNRTCYPPCKEGTCSGPPDYTCQCQLGWYGADCAQDCGCNNLSRCTTGPDTCDSCQFGSIGSRCEACPKRMRRLQWPSIGCGPCQCNEHGDEARDFCDSESGVCYCIHNTAGDHCDQCASGYFGDARNGGWCYAGYDGPTVLVNLTGNGTIGTTLSRNLFVLNDAASGLGAVSHYMWLMTTFSSIDAAVSSAESSKTASPAGAAIMLEVTELFVNCSSDRVYFYDNATAFMGMLNSPTEDSWLAGSFVSLCGDAGRLILSTTGFLGVYYQMPRAVSANNVADRRFFARYAVMSSSTTSLQLQQVPQTLSLSQSAVTCSRRPDIVYVLGSLPNIAAQPATLWQYNVSGRSWRQIDGSDGGMRPQRFYYHAGTCLNDVIYVHGGLSNAVSDYDEAMSPHIETVGNGTMLAYNTSTSTWYTLAVPGLPAVAGHTITAVSGNQLLLVGGYGSASSWNPHVYLLTAAVSADSEVPSVVATRHATRGPAPRSVFFHTAVFNALKGVLYVHGGYHSGSQSSSGGYSTQPSASTAVYALRVSTWDWDFLAPAPAAGSITPLPFSRYMHTAVDIDGKYMFVLGGLSDSSGHVPDPALYDYACNTWTTFNSSRDQSLVPAVRQGAVGLSDKRIAVIAAAGKTTTSDCAPPSCVTIISPSQMPQNGLCGVAAFPECSRRATCSQCEQLVTRIDVPPGCVWKNDQCVAASNTSSSNKSQCFNERCRIGSCAACARSGCIWTTAVLFQNDTHIMIVIGGNITGGSCMDQLVMQAVAATVNSTKEFSGSLGNVSEPALCPRTCSDYSTVRSCLEALGNGEAGPTSACAWSPALLTCMSPARRLLLCSQGECGGVITSSTPPAVNVTCDLYNRSCALCLARPWSSGIGKCVWVTRNQTVIGGQINVSTTGDGYCALATADLLSRKGIRVWNWQCPSVHPCSDASLNACNQTTEVCVELAGGQYQCDCAQGYVFKKPGDLQYDASCIERRTWHSLYGVCAPVCTAGLQPAGVSGGGCAPGGGCCVEPGTCRCKLGHVGSKCSIECACNGHSTCEPESPSVCLSCQHNTTGAACDSCSPRYVGHPVNGSQCWSCLSLCNNHSDVCTLPKTVSADMQANPLSNVTCFNCGNNTEGPTCSACKPGFFRLTQTGPCSSCLCNGHGTQCTSTTGECRCRNNTISVPSKDTKLWQNQCNGCTYGYDGRPTNDRQCYATILADMDGRYIPYCLSPDGLSTCADKNSSSLGSTLSPSRYFLPRGTAIFFNVAPRFFNIDIRVVMDIVNGSVDVLFTTSPTTFAVNYSATSNEHVVYADGVREPILDAAAAAATSSSDSARLVKRQISDRVVPSTGVSTADPTDLLANDGLGSASSSSSRYVDFDMSDSTPVTHLHLSLGGSNPYSYALVRGLSRRLVATFNHESYDFHSAKIYVIVIGRGRSGAAGLVLLRQDQVEINLFVFFAVFFAFVFTAISLAAIALKLRQLRAIRLRELQRREALGQMASRPFASVIAHVVDASAAADDDEVAAAAAADGKQPLLAKTQGSAVGHAVGGGCQDRSGGLQKTSGGSVFSVLPLAVEPLVAGSCAVVTVLVRLPGSSRAPMRGCLGSVLVTVKGPIAVATAPAASNAGQQTKGGGRGRSSGAATRPAGRQQQQQPRQQRSSQRPQSSDQRRPHGRGPAQASSMPQQQQPVHRATADGRAGRSARANDTGNRNLASQQQLLPPPTRGTNASRGRPSATDRAAAGGEGHSQQPSHVAAAARRGSPAATALSRPRSRLPPGIAETYA